MQWVEGDIEGVEIRKLQKHSDDRGWLAEIYRQDQDTPNPKMGYISFRKPQSRHPVHEHKAQTDVMLFPGIGRFKVRLWDNREKSLTYGNMMTFSTSENNPTLVIIPPKVVHSYKVLNLSGAYVLNFPDQLYGGELRKGEIDEIRWEDREDCPFIF